MRTTKRGFPAQLIFAVVIAASCSVAGLWAQTLGQPPVEACKPGDFTVVGYPDEFGPKPDSNFRVLIDEKFNGQFLTTDRIWVPVIQDTIEKWNGISGSTWSFDTIGLTDKAPDDEDGETTIAACGFQFECPDSVPTLPLGTAANQTILAVTLIFEDESRFRSITDSDVFFNPVIPFWTEPSTAQIDFATVLIHELGHVIGLGHNDNCVVGPTVMESIVDLGETRRNLSSAEMEGARFLYPDGSAPAIRIFESESTVRFESAEGLPAPFGQKVNIYGARGRRWIATPAQSWVTTKPPQGTFLLDSKVEIEVDTTKLGPGDHTATVALTLEDPGPTPGTLPPSIDPNPPENDQNLPGPPAIINVEVHIEPKPAVGVEPKLSRQGIVNGAQLRLSVARPGGFVYAVRRAHERIDGSSRRVPASKDAGRNQGVRQRSPGSAAVRVGNPDQRTGAVWNCRRARRLHCPHGGRADGLYSIRSLDRRARVVPARERPGGCPELELHSEHAGQPGRARK